LQKIRINVGDRDPRSGEFALNSGLTQGDQLIRYPTSTLRDGQAVEVGSRAAASSIPESQASVTNAR
jgi:membrane fusion protein, multidrug efflux system